MANFLSGTLIFLYSSIARIEVTPKEITLNGTMENATMRFGHCVLATRQGDMPERVRALYRLLRVTGAQGEALLIPRTYDGEG